MAGTIIMCFVCFLCAAVMFAIGAYAKKLDKPMWFWSGSEVKSSQITDVKQYNRENGRMWQLYSLWFFAAGLAEFWSGVVAVTLLTCGCTVGSVILVLSYNKIYAKYRVH